MISRRVIQSSLYIAIGVLVLTLTGIFGTFEERHVIQDGVNLSTVFLILVMTGSAYLVTNRVRGMDALRLLLNGGAVGVTIAAVLCLLVILQANVDLSFVFPNLSPLLGGTLTFGATELAPALVSLLVGGLVLGLAGGALHVIPPRLRRVLLLSLSLTVVIGLLESQIAAIITLPDAVTIAIAFALGYGVAWLSRRTSAGVRVARGAGAAAGILVAIALAALVGSGALEPGGLLRGDGAMPVILGQAAGNVLAFLIIFGTAGAVGGLAAGASGAVHNGAAYFIVSLIILGVVNWQETMTVEAAVLSFGLLALALWFVPPVGEKLETQFAVLPRPEQRTTQRYAFIAALLVLLVAPLFLGQYITDVLNLVGLYIIMGIGLNVVVGYAGLLDLGYVAFFAIGAYMIGLLTTPSMLTCGGVPPTEITPDNVATVCTGIMTFWQAWPLCIAASALAGILLGIPVLRLRGDYLAIVTLGFGEMIRIIVKFDDFKPLLGAAQGIANIPRPEINLTAVNPAWQVGLNGAIGIYYLVLAGILVTALIATRLSSTRLGRAWRAMRADEDVAQAMGIHLVRTKLLAFAIGAAFAGMGGAVAGTRLYGAYPDSYTLLVSINVLSLVIIGGLGSIPGVVVGALVLIGLPEALRELTDYRLLAFGVLLMVAMLLKPEGLIPPSIRRLSDMANERHAKLGVGS